MDLCVKKFEELTNDELYRILKLRVDVFVVEQACPYPELDDLDQSAVHIFLKDGLEILAYLRLISRGMESDCVWMGRVIARPRRQGLGSRLVKAALSVAREIFKASRVYIEAQTYAQNFYEGLGFVPIGEEFILDNIPHIKMLAKI